MYGDFPAKNTVYTPYILCTYECMVLANPSHTWSFCIFVLYIASYFIRSLPYYLKKLGRTIHLLFLATLGLIRQCPAWMQPSGELLLPNFDRA